MSFRWLPAAFVLFCFSPVQAAPLTLAGSVVDESGAPLAGVAVNVNGTAVASGAEGAFSASIDNAEVYTLRFSSENHFPAVHSFSPLDLEWSRRDGASTLPPVTLVARSEGRVMLTFGGDAMMGRRFSDPYPGDPVLIRPDHRAEDTRALLRHMKPYLELADFSSVNLETQVMAEQPEQNAPKSFVFYTPPEAVAAFRDAGVDYVTLGNNHSNDYLEAGMISTLAALEAAGMPFSGGGMNAAIGILLALLARTVTGKGQFIDISMTDGAASLLSLQLHFQQIDGRSPRRGDSRFSHRYACYNTYETRDGRYIAIGAVENRFWQKLCVHLEVPEYSALQFDEERRKEILAFMRGSIRNTDLLVPR